MKKLLLILTFFTFSFAHSGEIHTDKNLNYGVFGNATYRDSDLYPKGIPLSFGYELHGESEKANIEHYGGFIYGKSENFNFAFEVNKHIDSENSANDLVERANIGYNNDFFSIKLGRDNHQISFLDTNPFGYGFIRMPLYLDSFFDTTLFADGLFVKTEILGVSLFADYSQDIYNEVERNTIKFQKDFSFLTLSGFFQQRGKLERREDLATTAHSHSHDNTGCSALEDGEICLSGEATVIGVGVSTTIFNHKILSEYSILTTERQISTSDYRVENQLDLNSFYLQLTSTNASFNYGIRSEYFWHTQEFTGGGSQEVYDLISPEDEDYYYLQTLNLNYKIGKFQHILLEGSNSQDDNSFALSYRVRFSN